jgi:lysylphosphatidylglycerol synthetase-like protein (DUF2156 family)
MSKPVKQPTGYRIYSQYVLVGAAVGLYYGIFYRSSQPPDFAMATILALVAGVLTTAVRNWKKQKTIGALAMDLIKITGMFLVFLFALQLNPVIQGIGGRTAVIVFMTLVGIIFGLVMGVTRRPTHV